MPEGGFVRIEAANQFIELKDRLPLSPGHYVRMRVIDSGDGISQENLSKIFDPFFTTKPKGTGLGLTTAYWIIKRHQGHITIDSKPGEGTIVSVYLPKSNAVIAKKTISEENLIPGRGRILFMDDEEAIRELAAEVLNQLGYAVDCAQDGLEATQLFRKAHASGNPYTAVILDLVVRTGMGGREAMERLREIDPEAMVIVSSGYSNDPVLSDYKNYGFSGWITKPYTVQSLSRILAEGIEKEGITD
jgi:CheY-like chemotaxis protein